MSCCSKLGKEPCQIKQAGSFSAGSIQSDCQMFSLTEDRFYQTAKAGGGTDFYKGADPCRVHRFNLGNKFDRRSELACQKLLCCQRFRRIKSCGTVGVNRNIPLPEVNIVERGEKRSCCIGYQRTVESCRNRQFLAGKVFGGEDSSGPVNFTLFSRQDGLRGSITIGNNQLESLFDDDLFDRRELSRHCQHPPPVSPVSGHQPAAQAGEIMEGRFINAARGAERRQFTIAVACSRVRIKPERFQNPECADTDGTDRRLGSISCPQPLLIAACSSFGKVCNRVYPVREAAFIREEKSAVSCCKGGVQLREGTGKIEQHAGVL